MLRRRQKRRRAAAERRAPVEGRGPETVVETSGKDGEDSADHGTRGHDGAHPACAHVLRHGKKDERELQAPRREAKQEPMGEKMPEGCAKLGRNHERRAAAGSTDPAANQSQKHLLERP